MFTIAFFCRADRRGHFLEEDPSGIRRSNGSYTGVTRGIPCRGRLAVSCRQRKRFQPKTVSRPVTCTGYQARSKEQGRARGHNRGSTSGCGPVRATPTSPEHRLYLSTLYRRWTFLCRLETTQRVRMYACTIRAWRAITSIWDRKLIIEACSVIFRGNFWKLCHERK